MRAVGRADGITTILIIDAPQRLVTTLHPRQVSLGTVQEDSHLCCTIFNIWILEITTWWRTSPTPIYELVNLQQLQLAQNQWTDINDRIGELILLEHLGLSPNDFQEPLADGLKNLTQLKKDFVVSP